MKIRTDFVTNSSSSSFIIATNQEVPEQYKNVIKRLSLANAMDVIKQISNYEWETISGDADVSDEELQDIAKLTDLQMSIIKLAVCGQLSTYQALTKTLMTSEQPVYHIHVDRDWLSEQYGLVTFIKDATLIDDKYDI